tara:strand:- start:24607 stop:25050 length:444 start_codon:yes stop_codon:yes gene_type:complete
MAKLGRYSAQRRKVEVLTAAKTVEVHDCGTTFMLDNASGFVTTLPGVAAAGQGWWCDFIVKTDPGANDYTINTHDAGAGSEDVLVGLNFHNNLSGNAAEGDTATASDSFAFDGSAGTVVGERIHFFTDGLKWYALSHTKELLGGVLD